MKNIKNLLVTLLVVSSGHSRRLRQRWQHRCCRDRRGRDGRNTGTNPCAGSNVLVVSSSPDDAAKLCVGWSAAKGYNSLAECVTALTPTLTAATARPSARRA